MIKLEKIIEFFEQEGLLKKEYKGKKADFKHPNHGNCCTCQVCGYFFDECVCDHNNTIEWLELNTIERIQNEK